MAASFQRRAARVHAVSAPGPLSSVLAVAFLTALLGSALAGLAGWQPGQVLAGLAAYAVVGSAVAVTASWHLGVAGFGLPNQVTLLRAGLACLVAGSLLASHGRLGWSLAGLVALSLALDGLDGWLARRLRLVSRFGARFDMEIDALFLLILALLVWQAGRAGPWVLGIGLMRYAFVAAGWAWPTLQGALPPSRRRKAVCALQGMALLAGLLPPVPPGWAGGLAMVALFALAGSFAADLRWLLRRPAGRA